MISLQSINKNHKITKYKTMRNSSPLLAYLNTPIRYYYFYLIPLGLALLMVSFDVHFKGMFPSTITSNLSSRHKFLNDFSFYMYFPHMYCHYFYSIIFQLNRQHTPNIKQHYACKITEYTTTFNVYNRLGLVFFSFL